MPPSSLSPFLYRLSPAAGKRAAEPADSPAPKKQAGGGTATAVPDVEVEPLMPLKNAVDGLVRVLSAPPPGPPKAAVCAELARLMQRDAQMVLEGGCGPGLVNILDTDYPSCRICQGARTVVLAA